MAEPLDGIGGAQVAARIARGLLRVGEAVSVACVAADGGNGVAQRAGGDLSGFWSTHDLCRCFKLRDVLG